MLSEPIREQIKKLHQQGTPLRGISRQTGVSRNAIRRLIRRRAEETPPPATSRLHRHSELIHEIFQRCRGNGTRVHEILEQEHGIRVAYSTLTRFLREVHLRNPPACKGVYTFQPGEEMQFDTSPHRVLIDGRTQTLQCAALVLAYSRTLFAAYYRRFRRFEAKCFLADAFRYLDGAACTCLIDNTSVVLAAGSGANAQISPEMAGFARAYGVAFAAHRINHPERKGRVERPFRYLETNFLAGRTFSSLQDLNASVRDWCDQVANRKVKRVLGMSPQAAYLMQKPALRELPKVCPPVYESLFRMVDTTGYIHVERNRYSVPERLVGKRLEVHRTLSKLKVYFRGALVAEHGLCEKRDQRITLDAHRQRRFLRESRQGTSAQEDLLRGRNPLLDTYLDRLKTRVPGRGVHAMKRLLHLVRTYPEEAFSTALQHAHHYGLFDLHRLEKLVLDEVAGDYFQLAGEEDFQ